MLLSPVQSSRLLSLSEALPGGQRPCPCSSEGETEAGRAVRRLDTGTRAARHAQSPAPPSQDSSASRRNEAGGQVSFLEGEKGKSALRAGSPAPSTCCTERFLGPHLEPSRACQDGVSRSTRWHPCFSPQVRHGTKTRSAPSGGSSAFPPCTRRHRCGSRVCGGGCGGG